MEYTFEAKVQLVIEKVKGSEKQRHVCTNISLDVSDNLDKGRYVDNEGLPTNNGLVSLTNTLVQGLIANIHLSHQKGHRDSAEHLRFVISELERGFIERVTIEKGYFKEKNSQ